MEASKTIVKNTVFSTVKAVMSVSKKSVKLSGFQLKNIFSPIEYVEIFLTYQLRMRILMERKLQSNTSTMIDTQFCNLFIFHRSSDLSK